MGDSVRYVRAGRLKALAYSRLKEFDSAIVHYEKLLPIARRYGQIAELAQMQNSLGISYTMQARYDLALGYHFQSLEYRERIKDTIAIAITFHNIGFNYYKMKDYEKALSYFDKSMKLKSDVESNIDVEGLILNITLCYAYLGKLEEARVLMKQLIQECHDKCSQFIEVNISFNYGVIALQEGDTARALTNFLKSYKVAKELGEQRLLLDNIIYLGELYIKSKNSTLAIKYLGEAEKLISGGSPYRLELIKVYRQLYSLYKTSGDLEKYAHYQARYIDLKDKIYNEELTRNLMRLEGEFLERENIAKIAAQAQVLDLNEEIISRQRTLNVAIGAAVILLVVLTIVLVRANRSRKKLNLSLEERVRERTMELEVSRDSLLRAMAERDIVFSKISTETKSSLATIRGLCSLGVTEVRIEDRTAYLRKIDQTSQRLLETLQKTFDVAKSIEVREHINDERQNTSQLN
jgi:tetratricopeptide (TPR) repeat protein